ncbi:hypothetical protein D9611_011132 [Ephemerocybe angulata]|uniref:Uncharacterized protein n=1 Tax=Ephemerocybe angulata TaxID=980116 RepID=A0A8H5CCX0_9AGAR|nr:hypothetical protein D9611_011132 [Tulosesus angulatus]
MIATWPRFDKLTHLKVTNTGTLPIPVILSFLHANPSVEVVQLLVPPVRDHNLLETSPQLVGLEVNIKELTATPWDLGAFLSFHPILPHLESLEIYQVKASVWEEGTTEWDRIAQFIQHNTLPKHSGAQGRLQRLKLSFSDEYRLEEWLYNAVASPWTGKDGTLREPIGEIALVKALASCPSLTFLHVSTRDVPRRLYFHPDIVVDFIAAFPSLQTVILQGLFYNPPDDHRGKNSSAFWHALARLWEVCSALRTLEIRDLTEGSESGAAVWRNGRKEGPAGGLDLYRGAFPWAGITQSGPGP